MDYNKIIIALAIVLVVLAVGGSVLLIQSNSQQKSMWKPTLWILWIFLTLAAAGPAFNKLPVPTSTALPNTVIIFDLGPSMQGQTLTTAKIKLHDI